MLNEATTLNPCFLMGQQEFNWREWIEKGDELSFSIIYNTHVNNLFSYGRGMGFSEDNCKDAIQETFIRLHLHRKRMKHVQNITAYLFKMFKNNLLDQKERSMKEEAIDPHSKTFSVNITVLDNIIDMETSRIIKEKVAALLNHLTPSQREVIYLKYMMGLKHKEIAEILNINEESARKLLYRAMEKLRTEASCNHLLEKLLLVCLLHLI